MKKVYVQLKVINETDNINVSQKIAGGLPQINSDTPIFYLDGKDDDEILTKLVINVMATYYTAINKNNKFENFSKKWKKCKKILKNEL